MPDSSARARRRLLTTALLVAAAASSAALGVTGCSRLRDMGLDGRPLTVDTPIGPLTRWRLLRSTDDPQACRDWLEQSGVAFTPVQDRAESDFASSATPERSATRSPEPKCGSRPAGR